ncbi:MAG: hypothetical protein KME45_20175 [Stenomitos rutilans HA7619-LM2]|nr:hypothetical protein [Stenomitos rutilans HA7619-LM2]
MISATALAAGLISLQGNRIRAGLVAGSLYDRFTDYGSLATRTTDVKFYGLQKGSHRVELVSTGASPTYS